jgi:hypothetical protein
MRNGIDPEIESAAFDAIEDAQFARCVEILLWCTTVWSHDDGRSLSDGLAPEITRCRAEDPAAGPALDLVCELVAAFEDGDATTVNRVVQSQVNGSRRLIFIAAL